MIKKLRLLMRLDYGISIIVRGTLAGNVCVSATHWNRVATMSAPVLPSTPDSPHLPPGPLPLPHGERKGERGDWRERTLAPLTAGLQSFFLVNSGEVKR